MRNIVVRIVLVASLVLFCFMISGTIMDIPSVSALPAGFQEFYAPLPAAQTQDVFVNIHTGPTESMHYVVGVTASADNTVIYYDHWENGYSSGAAGDQVVALSKGQVHKFESSNIPTNPRGTATYYDGGDRIFVAGSLLQLVVSTWPEATGTVFTDAWEVYPVQAWANNYAVPVGENLGTNPSPGYDDFDKTWILVMSGTNGNAIQIRSPTGTLLASTTLNKGISYAYEVGQAGTTVSSTAPVQVQIIAGQPATAYEMRGYTITPSQYWGTSYWAPVPSWTRSGSTPDTDLFLYNPNTNQITVYYQDLTGSGSFTLAAGATRSYQAATGRYVPKGSGVHLWSSSVFWGLPRVTLNQVRGIGRMRLSLNSFLGQTTT